MSEGTPTVPVNGETVCACGGTQWQDGKCVECGDVPENHPFGCGCIECDPYEGP